MDSHGDQLARGARHAAGPLRRSQLPATCHTAAASIGRHIQFGWGKEFDGMVGACDPAFALERRESAVHRLTCQAQFVGNRRPRTPQ